MIVLLNAHGYLPAGFHSMTLEEIKSAFVDGFPDSMTRPQIFDGYQQFCTFLHNCGVVTYTHLLDGSFITSKENPNDIDCVTFVDDAMLNSLTPDQQQAIWSCTQPGFVKSTFGCDNYFCKVYPDGDMRNHNQGEGVQGMMYWRGVFGFDRNNVPKGMIVRKVDKGVLT